MKVLIADDHSIVREGLKQYVMTLDEVKSIDEAVNGNEAWAKIKVGNYDLVILDVAMPGMSDKTVSTYRTRLLKKMKSNRRLPSTPLRMTLSNSRIILQSCNYMFRVSRKILLLTPYIILLTFVFFFCLLSYRR